MTVTRIKQLSFLSAVLSTVLSSGCMVGPDYRVPETRVNDAWIEESGQAVNRDTAIDAAWWKVFDDPVLVRLVEDAYRNNLDLRVAGVRVLQAMAQRNVMWGNLWPQSQAIGGAYSRTRASDNFAAEGFPPAPEPYWNSWLIGFDASWELDFWGKIRRSIEAADAELDASIASYDNVMVSLVAEVAATYVLIRAAEEQIRIAQNNIKVQEHAVFLTQERFDAGATSLLDVTQAKSFLAQTQADLANYRAEYRSAVFQLGALLGRPPSLLEEYLREPGKIPFAPRDVAAGAPADLLRRRPDVRLAERTAAAQSALIGAEKANLYPSFALVGSIGLQANKFSQLWRTDSWTGAISSGFSWPFLNYGRITNSVRAQDAAFQAAATNYQNTVLKAAQEVESSLAAFRGALEQADWLAKSEAQAQRSVNLSLEQYLEGEVSYMRVLQAQQTLLSVQTRRTAVRGATATNLIATYKALGGGWEIRAGLRDLIPLQMMDEMRERTNWGDYFDRISGSGAPGTPQAGK
jgi:NodT family efflux transporter outer membrane factor (OMF) lipoprotein